MLKLSHFPQTSFLKCPSRSHGWFWKYQDRNLWVLKGVFWQPRFLELNMKHYYHIKSEILKTWKCCKIIYRDSKWCIRKKYLMTFHDEPITMKERIKMHVTKIDVLKMIPFSFFIIVPGAELTLPLCLYLFPNMIPSSFISKTKEEKSIIHLLDARNVYADALHIYMLKQLRAAGDEYNKFEDMLIRNPQSLTKKDLIEFHDLFPKFFGFAKMDPEALINACRMLTMEPWTGFKVIGRMFFDPYFKIKSFIYKQPSPPPWTPNNYVCNFISRYLLIYQLKQYMNRIREDDYILLHEDFDDSETDITIRCCRERAIETENTNYQKIKEDILEWITFSTHPLSKGKVSNEFMLLSQIFPYLQDIVYVDENRADVKASDERTKNLLYKISQKKWFGFSERGVHRIIFMVHTGVPAYFDKEARLAYIDKLKQTIDEKHMPEDEDEIKEVIKILESVPPDSEDEDAPSNLAKPGEYKK